MILIARMRRIQSGNEPDWLVEVPILNAATQGETKEEAIEMAKDLVLSLFEAYFGNAILKDPVAISVFEEKGSNRLRIICQPSRYLYALVLRRQREAAKVSVREVAARLDSGSPNAYARYERGEVVPSAEMFNRLLQAIDPETCHGLVLR